ncbi:hypothetical protein MUP01_01005 [Candidatus Bathyarchaeota archaeon]|nr:hypothetical protein [Candidatus Bathyarchaeota archaeon]
MDLEDSLSKTLCYVYMGQQTGNRGLLKSDLESYEKTILKRSGTASDLAELGLVFEFRVKSLHRYGKSSWQEELVFLKTSIKGAEKAREIMLDMAETSDVAARLETIPSRAEDSMHLLEEKTDILSAIIPYKAFLGKDGKFHREGRVMLNPYAKNPLGLDSIKKVEKAFFK